MTICYPCPDLHGAAGSDIDDKHMIGLLPFQRGSIFFLQDKLFPQSFRYKRGRVLLSEGRTASVVPAMTPTKQYKPNHVTTIIIVYEREESVILNSCRNIVWYSKQNNKWQGSSTFSIVTFKQNKSSCIIKRYLAGPKNTKSPAVTETRQPAFIRVLISLSKNVIIQLGSDFA